MVRIGSAEQKGKYKPPEGPNWSKANIRRILRSLGAFSLARRSRTHPERRNCAIHAIWHALCKAEPRHIEPVFAHTKLESDDHENIFLPYRSPDPFAFADGGNRYGAAERHADHRLISASPKVEYSKMATRFRLDRAHGKFLGVCAGIAQHFGWDPMLVRAGFVIGTLAGFGSAILIYIAIALIAD